MIIVEIIVETEQIQHVRYAETESLKHEKHAVAVLQMREPVQWYVEMDTVMDEKTHIDVRTIAVHEYVLVDLVDDQLAIPNITNCSHHITLWFHFSYQPMQI